VELSAPAASEDTVPVALETSAFAALEKTALVLQVGTVLERVPFVPVAQEDIVLAVALAVLVSFGPGEMA
jgi:hypothetical protein